MTRSKARFSVLGWLIFSIVSGGGVSGFLNPDWPVVGPLVTKLIAQRTAVRNGESTDLPTAAAGLLGSIGTQGPGQSEAATAVSAQRPSDSLLIASFNIQVLGKSKMSKPDVVEILAYVIRHFDIVAIQEVRAKEDDIVPRLVAAVNATGGRYHYLVGPRLGRSVSTEQYVFVYDTNRIEHDPSSVGTMSDPSDMLHREPFVARFRPRTSSPNQAFSFWLINTHTDPDEVKQEVDVLADVFQVMRTARPDEDDVILLGDLNASESQLGRLGQIPGVRWAVSNAMTNTRKPNHTTTSSFTARRPVNTPGDGVSSTWRVHWVFLGTWR